MKVTVDRARRLYPESRAYRRPQNSKKPAARKERAREETPELHKFIEEGCAGSGLHEVLQRSRWFGVARAGGRVRGLQDGVALAGGSDRGCRMIVALSAALQALTLRSGACGLSGAWPRSSEC